MKACDVPYKPLSQRELRDLEIQAGRKFLSELQALTYLKRQLNSWHDPLAAQTTVEERP